MAKDKKNYLAGCRRERILYTGKFLPDRPYIVVESTEVRATRSRLPKIASHSTEIWAIYQSNLSPTGS